MRGGGPERAAAGPAGSLCPCGSLLQDCLLSRGRTPIHPSKPSPKSTSSEEPFRLSLALHTPFSPSAHNTSTPRPRWPTGSFLESPCNPSEETMGRWRGLE
ncbi:unnamed protein product [Nyctereutes procyonoides]|uniref:(raccoon dog) hypothetical protein n=1 Tax=Nyctereutes procyonoides TaxID=34880 RepID=A0A811XTT0_NYCPR|nr:unnamed protein product [Nyctereutes procyonoides]